MKRDTEGGVAGRIRNRGLLAALLAIAAVAALPASASAGSQTPCPGGFTVLHNDHIGKLQLPAGRYQLAVETPARLTCARTSQLFARFLQSPSGNLPPPWRLNVRKARFVSGSGVTRVAFHVSKLRSGGVGGGGGGGGGAGNQTCPSFRVLHDDRIGSLRIPAGNYIITVKRMSCPAASAQFANFLQKPSGRLGGGWQLKPRKAKFRNLGLNQAFRIKRAS